MGETIDSELWFSRFTEDRKAPCVIENERSGRHHVASRDVPRKMLTAASMSWMPVTAPTMISTRRWNPAWADHVAGERDASWKRRLSLSRAVVSVLPPPCHLVEADHCSRGACHVNMAITRGQFPAWPSHGDNQHDELDGTEHSARWLL